MTAIRRSEIPESNPGVSPDAGARRPRRPGHSARGEAAIAARAPSPYDLVIPLSWTTIITPYRPVAWDGTYIRKYRVKGAPL